MTTNKLIYTIIVYLSIITNGFAQAEITVKSNNNTVINNGTSTTSRLQGTYYGTLQAGIGTKTSTFWIINTGNASLDITGAISINRDATHFNITQPSFTNILAGDSTSFTITYAPQAIGRHGEIGELTSINIPTNDVSNTNYTFGVRGFATSGAPIDCSTGRMLLKYEVGGSTPTLFDIDYTSPTLALTSIGTASFNYNAMGYNHIDGYIYAFREDPNHRNKLYVIGDNGTPTLIGIITHPNIDGMGFSGRGFYAGDFDDNGNIYIKTAPSGASNFFRVDLQTMVATNVPLSESIQIDDFTYSNDGLIYSLSKTNELVVIDPITGNVTVTPASVSNLGGATFSDPLGNIFAITETTRHLVQLDYTNLTESIISFGNGISVDRADGAHCGTFNLPDRPEAIVKGGGITIDDEDLIPSLEDGTAFGPQQVGTSGITKTFWILNEGIADLTIGTIDIQASAGAVDQYDVHYTVGQPATTTIATGDSVSFTITYAPTTRGTHGNNSGTRISVNIPTNDVDEANYNFNISGIGLLGGPIDCAAGKVLFTHNNSSSLFDLDYTDINLSVTNLGNTGILVDGTAIHPQNNFVYAMRRNAGGTRNDLFVTGDDGQDQLVGDISGLNGNLFYLAADFDSDGYYYTKQNINSTAFYKIDVHSLETTTITLSQSIRIFDMAYREQDSLFYAVSNQGTIGLVSINPKTGEVILIGNNGISTNYESIFASDDGRIYGQATTGRIYELNIRNGSQDIVTNDPTYNLSFLDGASCGTFTFTAQPRAIVKGNNILIPDGDTSPNAEDGTAFGTQQRNVGSVTRTFWILNEGITDLSIGTLDIRATANPVNQYDNQYTIVQPTSSIISAGDSVSFTITYAPQNTGRHGANTGPRAFLTFTTNDLDGDFNFDIHGTCISGDPIDCSTGKMLVSSDNATRVYDLDYTDSNLPRTNFGNTGLLFDGIAIHPDDNFVYAMRRNAAGTRSQLWVMGDNGQDEYIGTVSGLNSGHLYLAADFDTDGYYYTKRDINDAILYKVDVRSVTATPITLSQSIRILDMAYREQDSLFYAVSDLGVVGLVSINPRTGEVILIGNNNTTAHHAVYSSTTGEIYGQSLTGELLEYDLTDGHQDIVTNVPTYNLSFPDGASCGALSLPPRPEMVVKGGGIVIFDEEDSPNSENGTSFGTQQVNVGSITQTFWILNEGTADLTIGTLDIQASAGAVDQYDIHYTITPPTSTLISAGDSVSFSITYAPTVVGRHGANTGPKASIHIHNNDFDGTYNYTIHGTSISGNPIDCSSGKILFTHNNTTRLYNVDYTNAGLPVTELGNTGLRFNGIGINPTDNFIYMMRIASGTNQLWVMGDNGQDEYVGTVNGLTNGHSYQAGAFSKTDGYYYVKRDVNDAILYKVDTRSAIATPITLTQSIRIYDMAYREQDGLFYAVSNQGTIGLVSINPNTGEVILIGNNGATAHNAVYASSTGEIYAQSTTGELFQYDLTDGSEFIFSDDPTYNLNNLDGAACGALNFDVDLEVSKVDDNITAYTAGEKNIYTVIIKNNGPFSATNAIVSNPLPSGVTNNDFSWIVTSYGTAISSYSGTNTGTIQDTISIASGDSIVYTITIDIPTGYTGNLVNTATITTSSNTTDTDLTNNSKTDTDVNQSLSVETCNNGIDDDGDGLIDCFDTECYTNDSCEDFYFGGTQPECPKTLGSFSIRLEKSGVAGVSGYSQPAIGDIDGDGIPDIVATNTNRIQVLNGNDASLKFNISRGINQFNPGASIADIDKDGKAEIYLQASNRRLYKYDHTGTQVWQSTQQFGINHCGSFNCNPPNWNIQSSVRPSFADFDGDGQAEIYMGNEIWNAMTGSRIVRPANSYYAAKGAQNAALSQQSSAYDILPDSYCADCSGMELICGNTVYSVNIATQTMTVVSTSPSYGDGYTALADWNGDGLMDIIVTDINGGGGAAPFVYIWDPRTKQLIKTDKTGNTLADRVFVGGGTGDTGVPAGGIASIADFDGDGVNEIAIVGRNRIYIVESNLSISTSMVVNDPSSETTCTAFDFDGDGEVEIVYRDAQNLRILYYDGTSLTVKATTPCTSGTRLESPVVADVDADGEAEIICTCGSQTRIYGSDVSTSWLPTRKVWNVHGYIPTLVNDDLTIPSIHQNKALIPTQDIFLSQSQKVDSNGNIILPATPDLVVSIDTVIFTDPCTDTIGTATVTICNEDFESLEFGYSLSYYKGNPSSGGTLIGKDTVVVDSVNIVSASCFEMTFEVPNEVYDLYVYVNDDASNLATVPNITIEECDSTNNFAIKRINTKPLLSITDPSPACIPNTIDLTDTNITTGSINIGTNTYYTNATATSLVTDETAVGNGVYYIITTNSNGCTDTAAVNVTVQSAPNLSITNPDPICQPSTIDLTDADIISGSTNLGTNTYYTNAAATSLVADETAVGNGTFYIVSTLGTCADTAAVNVTVNNTPNLSITNPDPICQPNTI
ncbi:MAG: choice-of-anchor D domain-containing protein, partial [Cytophagales bacterium]|nr:choice-of-anchor D domain-containing protein [Cytophagales bacterium]